MKHSSEGSGRALIPFILFVGLYLGIGISLTVADVDMAFYQFPILVSCFVGIIAAFFLHKGTIDEKFNALLHGMGNQDIMTMCMIYLLAGAFSASMSAMGGAESTVHMALRYIPSQFLIAGIFLVAAILSLAMGSSMGTISAVGAIAVPLATTANLNIALTLGALLGGAMFGDNLSFISDTTIAATKSQNVAMRDKFNLNIKIALPSAILTFILLLFLGRPESAPQIAELGYDLWKVLPYFFVLIAAMLGMNVFIVLTGGIVLSVIIGIASGGFAPLAAAQSLNNGMLGMFEIFTLSILAGGLSNMVQRAGGIQWLLNKVSKNVRSRTSAELSIAGLVSVVDAATANNTIAIILSGPIAKNVSSRFHVDPRRVSSLLDTFSCVLQGLIPYGAQMLLIVSFTNGALSPFDVIPYTWYVFFLAIIAIVSMFIPFADGACRKDPWNYEWDCPESEVEQKKQLQAAEKAN